MSSREISSYYLDPPPGSSGVAESQVPGRAAIRRTLRATKDRDNARRTSVTWSPAPWQSLSQHAFESHQKRVNPIG